MGIKILAIVLLSIGLSTIAGVGVGIFFRNITKRLNDIVLGFAAGVMLAASMLGLVAPSFESDGFDLVLAIIGILAGAGATSILDRIVPHLHRIAGLDSETGKADPGISKTLLFVAAIALHKIPEGLATGVSFATGSTGDVLTVASSISLQNIPEAMVMVTPLFATGVAVRRVLAISLGIAAASAASVLTGVAAASVSAGATPFLLAAAGGAILYVISDEMIPETHSNGNEKAATFALIAGLILVILMQKMFQTAAAGTP